MQVYKLTEEEIQAISELNESRQNVLLIICSFSDDVTGVVLDDLESEAFSDYRALLDETLDPERIIEIEEQTEI